MTFKLTSRAFAAGARIPQRHTCDGDNVSPALVWSGAPEGVKSYAIVCSDADAPGGTFYHWALCDIAATARELPEGAGQVAGGHRLRQASNDFGRAGYGGPCPPRGHGVHHYQFRIFALNVEQLPLHGKPGCRDIERAARAHVLAEATLVGLYER